MFLHCLSFLLLTKRGKGGSVANLIFLINGYPYGPCEPYLETEIESYNNYFGNIYICSLPVRRVHRETKGILSDGKFNVCRVDYAPRYVHLLNSFRAFSDINFYRKA